jgi:hypothetical protein
MQPHIANPVIRREPDQRLKQIDVEPQRQLQKIFPACATLESSECYESKVRAKNALSF